MPKKFDETFKIRRRRRRLSKRKREREREREDEHYITSQHKSQEESFVAHNWTELKNDAGDG